VDDRRLAERLVFDPHAMTLVTIPKGAGPTPDFQVILGGIPVAYCELKSPRDEWLDKSLALAKPCQVVGGGRNDPTFNRIARLVQKAADQFRAVNATRSIPNILVSVNHDGASGFGDLMETFTGLFHASDGSRHVTMPQVASRLKYAKKHIDLCVWIDGNTSKVQGYYFNRDTTPNHLPQLCALLGKNPADIKH
jgi:hypothetical protein